MTNKKLITIFILLGLFFIQAFAQLKKGINNEVSVQQISEAKNEIEKTIDKIDLISSKKKDKSLYDNYDKIITLDKKVLIVKIQNITERDIRFLYPLNTDVHMLNRSEVSQIHYASGRIDLFKPLTNYSDSIEYVDNNKVITKDEDEWKNIVATYNEYDIRDYTDKGEIYAVFKPDRGNVNKFYLERNALIIMKKKAARLGADYILITSKTINGAYGELPFIKLIGTAYSID